MNFKKDNYSNAVRCNSTALIGISLVLIFSAFVMPARAFHGQLTPDQVRNAKYHIYSLNEDARMVNGSFEFNPDNEHFTDFFHVDITKVKFGDLNNDGEEEAAVILESMTRGTGRFYELAIVRSDQGEPRHIISVQLGDRVIIESMAVEKGEIILSMVVHGPGDALCCPTVKKVVKYRLSNDALVETK